MQKNMQQIIYPLIKLSIAKDKIKRNPAAINFTVNAVLIARLPYNKFDNERPVIHNIIREPKPMYPKIFNTLATSFIL